jgi:hypothetical protein
VSESNNGTYFSTVVQPNVPLVLGTDMNVTLDEVEGETKVQVKIESQPFIMGDVFGMYDRYAADFFKKLSNKIKVEKHENLEMAVIQFHRPTSEKWDVLATALFHAALIAIPLILILLLHPAPVMTFLLSVPVIVALVSGIRFATRTWATLHKS